MYKPSINHDYRDWWTKYSELNKRSSAERIPETSSNQDSPSIIIESVSVLLYYVATPSTRHHICYNICFLSLSLWLTCARANVNIKDLKSWSNFLFLIYNQPPWTYQRNHFLVTLADTSTKPSNLGHLRFAITPQIQPCALGQAQLFVASNVRPGFNHFNHLIIL